MHPVYILLIILMVSFLSYLSWISSSAKVCRTSIKGTKTNVLSPSGTSRNGCLLIWVLGGFSYFPKDNIFQRILKRPEILFHIWQEVLTAFGLSQDKWWLQILTAVKVQPGPRRPMRQIRDEQRLLTCLMRFSLWETWKARCAMSLARLILLHQTPKWRLQERAETEVCVFFFFKKKKGGSHTRLDSSERPPCSCSSQRIGNEKLPEKPGAERMWVRKPADWAVTTEEVSPYKGVCSFPNKDMFSLCAGSVQ